MRELLQFLQDLHQEVVAEAELAPEGALKPDVFTTLMISYLTDAGEVDDGEVCYHRRQGVEVSGYNIDEEERVLTLFSSIYKGAELPVTVGKQEIETAFRRMETLLSRCTTSYHEQLDPASPEHDMMLTLERAVQAQFDVRLFVLTDCLVSRALVPPRPSEGPVVAYDVWDLERVFRCVTSGTGREPIHVDFEDLIGAPLPCLRAMDASADYDVYMAIVPGAALNAIYETYGPRLLELNVRSFLQARGKVNKGIRETIQREPEHFLAFNNGISATASSVELVSGGDGSCAIRTAEDFQIVNGGQTTASIFHAAKRDNADISRVSVQAKLTVVPPDRVGSFVPLVSRYANTQNRINEADFSANDPFHVRLEELSRILWAPAAEGSIRQTKWFYERARGQYLDAIAREITPARRTEFKRTHPLNQKFTKTDVAKFENTWDQLPHLVSRGSEKNFRDFTVRLAKRGRVDVDEEYFRHLVAKAILFRRTGEIVSKLSDLIGYRANVVTYTIAYLCHATAQRIDLEGIWREQDLSTSLVEAVLVIAPVAYGELTQPDGGGNVTEWAKRQACWDRLSALRIPLPTGLGARTKGSRRTTGEASIDSPSREEAELIRRVADVEADVWQSLYHWAWETDNLEAWQRGIARTLAAYKRSRREPTRKQATQAAKILDEAARLGFEASVV